MSNLDYWLLLHSVPEIGPATFRKLLLIFGDPYNVVNATPHQLTNMGLNKNLVSSILSVFRDEQYSKHLSFVREIQLELTRRGFRIITLCEDTYPNSLKQIKNHPPIIYVYGKLLQRKNIAIIGTTQPSSEGKQNAVKFAYELASSGFTIISGYAKGIDTYAHLGAIKAGGNTIMVLPIGVLNFRIHNELYPVMNNLFSHSIILSEFFPTAKWETRQALLRNRIIAGLSSGVFVINPGTKGGSITTAKLAIAYNKPLFIHKSDLYTCGVKELHRLGAIEVSEPQEIVKLMRWNY